MTAQRKPDRRPRAAAGPVGLTVVIGAGSEARKKYEVTAPTHLIRAWRLLTAVNEELHTEGTDDAGARRAARLFNVLRDEVVRSVSPPLAEEVRELLPPLDEHSGVAETRAACSGALGWLDSLMTSMLMQLAAQGERVNGRPSKRMPPRRPTFRPHGR
ncbi:hypothetical protein [Actinomadura madurae]|uniref:hypothetical protein n=1 Tax=Actinomadura madurae TaxID=1993 RepID=UPI000D84FF1C|nr:hypothetical protein [Actinomadura madurae]SPT51164.1 Uncharacterised protein [Actinomadura madurae]